MWRATWKKRATNVWCFPRVTFTHWKLGRDRKDTRWVEHVFSLSLISTSRSFVFEGPNSERKGVQPPLVTSSRPFRLSSLEDYVRWIPLSLMLCVSLLSPPNAAHAISDLWPMVSAPDFTFTGFSGVLSFFSSPVFHERRCICLSSSASLCPPPLFLFMACREVLLAVIRVTVIYLSSSHDVHHDKRRKSTEWDPERKGVCLTGDTGCILRDWTEAERVNRRCVTQAAQPFV